MSARPPLTLVPQHFGSTVFDRRTSRYLPFDREATELLLAAVETPFDELLSLAPEGPRREALEGFFERLYHLGCFTLDLRFAGDVLPLTPPEGHLAGPLAVHLEVSASCNLACAHCFAGALPRREEALTLPELDALFATFARLGSFRLGLTGGEPLLRRDLLDVLDTALAHGLHPCVTTNGLLLTEDLARELGRRSLVWLNVSLDGATEASHDAVRGAGTFARTLERLEVLRRHARFTLAFTVTAQNAHEVRACASLAARVGARTAVFRPLYPVGNAAGHPELLPAFEEYASALDALAAPELLPSYDLHGVDPFGPRTRRERQPVVYPNPGCGAGNLVCSVSLGGDVNPCSFLGERFVGGNVRARPFEAIWHDAEVFRRMRRAPGEGATERGCRARALALSGSAEAPDPWLTRHAERPDTAHPLVVFEPHRGVS